MALIRCPECSQEVSGKAKSCPHCGYPLTTPENQGIASLPAPAPFFKPELAEPAGQGPSQIESRLAIEIPPWEKDDQERFKDVKAEAPKVTQSRIKIPPLLKRALLIGGGLALFMMALFVSGAFAPHPVVKPPAQSLEESLPKKPPKPVVYQPPKEDRGSDTDAYITAKDFVLSRLPTPATADFPFLDFEAFEMHPHKWRVSSYVDFQNYFGAQIRKHFIVDLTYLGNHKWACDSVVLY